MYRYIYIDTHTHTRTIMGLTFATIAYLLSARDADEMMRAFIDIYICVCVCIYIYMYICIYSWVSP